MAMGGMPQEPLPAVMSSPMNPTANSTEILKDIEL
jgi:hypothetical protein